MSSTAAAATAATASVGETCVVVVVFDDDNHGTLDDVVGEVGGGTAVDQTALDQIGFLAQNRRNKLSGLRRKMNKKCLK